MESSNHNLKRSLIIQSFAPLFLLLTIKYFNPVKFRCLLVKFCDCLPERKLTIIRDVIHHGEFGPIVVSAIGIVWLLWAILIAFGFQGLQKSGFSSRGERIRIEEDAADNSASFLVTYVLPLLTDDVSTFRELLVFLVMLAMVLFLLTSSNSFYQNPVLAAMKYRTFRFTFINPDSDIFPPDREYIGITHGIPISEACPIVRKYISDGVFVIYNE